MAPDVVPRVVPRALATAALAAAGVAGVLAAPAAPAAHAAPDDGGYRYWSFWERDGGKWLYATKGPGVSRPPDGSVHGVRFAVSAESGDGARPRGKAEFAEICDGGDPGGDRKRIALVIDFGTAAHAPDGERPPRARTECAVVPGDATLGDALAAVAEPLRFSGDGLMCAIGGYPESGCAEQVAGDGGGGSGEAGEAGTPDGEDDGTPAAGLTAGVAAVIAISAGAVWQLRRRRT